MKLLRSFQHDRMLNRCRFSPCGRYVLAAGLDCRLHRWDLESGAHTQIEGHASWIGDLDFHPSPEAGRLYSGDCHGALHCWPYAAAVPKPAWSVPQAHAGWIRALRVSPDGKLLVTGGNDGAVRVRSTADGRLLHELGGHAGHVFSAAFSPDGRALVTGDLPGVVRQWDTTSWKPVRELDASVLYTRREEFLTGVGGVRGLAFRADGGVLACCGLAEAESNTFCPGKPAVLLLDWATGKTLSRLRASERVDGYVNAVRFLPDGTLAGCGEGTQGAGLWIWKLDQADPVQTQKGPSGYDLDLHPDGSRLAAALYQAVGHTGNGRRRESGSYTSNAGLVQLIGLPA